MIVRPTDASATLIDWFISILAWHDLPRTSRNEGRFLHPACSSTKVWKNRTVLVTELASRQGPTISQLILWRLRTRVGVPDQHNLPQLLQRPHPTSYTHFSSLPCSHIHTLIPNTTYTLTFDLSIPFHTLVQDADQVSRSRFRYLQHGHGSIFGSRLVSQQSIRFLT